METVYMVRDPRKKKSPHYILRNSNLEVVDRLALPKEYAFKAFVTKYWGVYRVERLRRNHPEDGSFVTVAIDKDRKLQFPFAGGVVPPEFNSFKDSYEDPDELILGRHEDLTSFLNTVFGYYRWCLVPYEKWYTARVPGGPVECANDPVKDKEETQEEVQKEAEEDDHTFTGEKRHSSPGDTYGRPEVGLESIGVNLHKQGCVQVPLENLSDWGLLWQINKMILHPHGLSLALVFDDHVTCSGVALQLDRDLKTWFGSDLNKSGQDKLNTFLLRKEKILTEIIEKEDAKNGPKE